MQDILSSAVLVQGIAVSVDRSVYLSDGKTLRLINPQGVISTLVGGHHHLAGLGCGATSYLAGQLELHWPAQLAVSPLDSSLHLVDNNQAEKRLLYPKIVFNSGYSRHQHRNPPFCVHFTQTHMFTI